MNCDLFRVEESISHLQALVRDNYRCMLSGLVDMKSYNNSPRLQAQIESLPSPGPDLTYTNCCHIIPQYIGHGLGDNDKMSVLIFSFSFLSRFQLRQLTHFGQGQGLGSRPECR